MKTWWAILSAILVCWGCAPSTDYSAYADKNRPVEERIVSLDARMRFLMGDRSSDSSRLLRVFDTLEALAGTGHRTGSDSENIRQISEALTNIGLRPILDPNDSDLAPSLAWERRRAGCVPLVLFWCRMLQRKNISAVPVLIPGHLTVSVGENRWIETLRNGTFRSRSFYDSVFSLEDRPYYRDIRADSNAVLVSMLVHAGLLEWRREHVASAESAFRSAVQICPGLPEAEGNLGLLLEELKRRDEAIEHIQIALTGDPHAGAAAERLNRLISMEVP